MSFFRFFFLYSPRNGARDDAFSQCKTSQAPTVIHVVSFAPALVPLSNFECPDFLRCFRLFFYQVVPLFNFECLDIFVCLPAGEQALAPQPWDSLVFLTIVYGFTGVEKELQCLCMRRVGTVNVPHHTCPA